MGLRVRRGEQPSLLPMVHGVLVVIIKSVLKQMGNIFNKHTLIWKINATKGTIM